jgi:hypothetical protein
MRTILAIAVFGFVCVAKSFAQQPPAEQKDAKQPPPATCPMHDFRSQMNQRGEKAMGFSQTATTHHFFLNSNGGVIQVEVNDPADAATRDDIRMHLEHIAKSFQAADFDIPMFVHDTIPPGVPKMKQLRNSIHYYFEETPHGGRVVISTADENALAAVHQFLRFQIEEHKTGDSIQIR